MTSMVQSLRMDSAGGVTTITLNRPDALNAFDSEMAERLEAALRTADGDSGCRVVVLAGEGRAFSAGQDVHELDREERSHGPAAVGAQLRDKLNPIVLRIRSLRQPVVAAIDGVVAGAGLGVALAADVRIATDRASFVIAPMGIAFIPGVGSSALLSALIGLGKASELAFLGSRTDAETALSIGLIQRLVRSDELTASVAELAGQLAAQPTRTIGLTKRAFNRAVFPDLAAQLDYEASLQEIAAATEDHSEGLSAILEKRAPRFIGH